MSSPQKSANNLIIFYTGNGKGKTTASLGLALRALRDKMKVIMLQFIKSDRESGEISLKKILPQFEIKCFGSGFVKRGSHPESRVPSTRDGTRDPVDHKKSAIKGIQYALDLLKSKKYDVIILDEIFMALDLKLIKNNDIIDLITLAKKSKKTFLVLTGRGCPKSLYCHADLITEMQEIKHPFQKGIMAKKGIDY